MAGISDNSGNLSGVDTVTTDNGDKTARSSITTCKAYAWTIPPPAFTYAVMETPSQKWVIR